VVAAVIVGLCVYGAMILSPNVAMERRLTAALDEALTRDAQGKLVIADSPRLGAFKAESDRLWFVVATPDGQTASYGAVPEAYQALGPYVHLIKEADIRGAAFTGESSPRFRSRRRL
jgi:hypothetical protein